MNALAAHWAMLVNGSKILKRVGILLGLPYRLSFRAQIQVQPLVKWHYVQVFATECRPRNEAQTQSAKITHGYSLSKDQLKF